MRESSDRSKSEKRKYDRSNGLGEFTEAQEQRDDADCEFDSEGEVLPEEEQEFRKKEKARMRQEMSDAADADEHVVDNEANSKPKVWQEAGDNDDVSQPKTKCFSLC